MDENLIPIIISLAALLFCSAWFSACETAFTSLNRVRIKNLAASGDKRAPLVLKLLQKYDKLLSTVLIGSTVVNITAAALTTMLFVSLLGAKGVTYATIVTTAVVLVFGEISPKILVSEAPEAFALFSAPLMRGLIWLLTPLTLLFSGLKKLLTKLFRLKARQGITEAEILTIFEEAQQDGTLNENEGELLRSVIEFDDIGASEIFTPRVDVVAAAEGASREDVSALFAESGYSRIPIYRESLDNIIGVLLQKDFFRVVVYGGGSVRDAIKPVVFVSPTLKISSLLRLLQQNKTHMAVVTDEFGGTMGVVTLEDVLEELVGEIWDEHDDVVETILPVSENTWLVLGSTPADDFFEKFAPLRTCRSATVSGFVMEQLARVPEQGDRFEFENLSITVTKMDIRRVSEVRVSRKAEEPVDGAGERPV